MEFDEKISNPVEQRISDVFCRFDRMGDKYIESKYVGVVLRNLGCVPSKQEIAEFTKQTLSEDYEDEIYLGKFIEHLVPLLLDGKMKPATRKQLIEAFEFMDKNCKGYLTKDELVSLVTTHGETFNEEEVEKMLKLAVDPFTGHIPYDFYVNKLAYSPKEDIYEMAQKLYKELRLSLRRSKLSVRY